MSKSIKTTVEKSNTYPPLLKKLRNVPISIFDILINYFITKKQINSKSSSPLML